MVSPYITLPSKYNIEKFITEVDNYTREEIEMINVSNFFPKIVQVKDGFMGQLVMNNHIVWETIPQETEEEAELILSNRIVSAMQTLFEIVPDMLEPKALNGHNT